MTVELDNTYEIWNLEKPSIPPPSHLYHLEPIGMGTPNVESLTSYVARLAEAHCVLPVKLVMNEIALLVRPNFVLSSRNASLGKLYGQDISALNGTGTFTTNLVLALEALTLRNDLRFLTMLTWAEVISRTGLLRRSRAWCPTCYYEWRYTDKVIYEPLLWSLDVVKICPHHHQRLLENCPHCQKQLSTLAGSSRPGYCSKCVKWLGSFPKAQVDASLVLSENNFTSQLYVVESMGELIATAPSLLSPPNRERIALVTSAYINHMTKGNLSAFSSLVGISDDLVGSWRKGKVIPTIEKLLLLTHCLETLPLNFLTEEISAIEYQFDIASLPSKRQPQPKKHRKRVEPGRIHQGLLEALEKSPPLSLSEVARRLGYYIKPMRDHFPDLCERVKVRYANYQEAYRLEKIKSLLEAALEQYPPPSMAEFLRCNGYKGVTTFYKLFPKLCQKISERRTDYLKACNLENLKQIRQEIRQVAYSLQAQGIRPNHKNVSAHLTKPGAMWSEDAQAALREVRRELGWEN